MFLNNIKFTIAGAIFVIIFCLIGRYAEMTMHSNKYLFFVSVMMFLFGAFVDWYVYRLIKKAREERLAIYRATVWASHHVLNNFLNKLYLIQHHALQNGEFNDELSESMGKMIQEAAGQLMDLSRVEPITAEGIRESVAPK